MFGVRGWQKFHSLKMIRVAFSATLYSANRKRKGRNLKSLFKKIFYLFIFREKGRWGEKERKKKTWK